MKKRLVVFSALLALFLAGCAKPQTAWITDLDAAKADSAKHRKDLLIVFTGSDWNDPSKKLIADVFKDDFFKEGSKKYVLCHLDIVQDKTLLDEKVLEKNFAAATTYAVQALPYVVLQTPQGDVYAASTTDDKVATAKDFFAFADGFKDARKKLVDLKKKVERSRGIEKVKNIDTFVEATNPATRDQYSSLIRQVPGLDPENKSGLLGKYTIQVAYLDSIDLYKQGKMTEASDCFIKAVDGGALDGAQKQEALYMTAYLLAMSGTADNAKIISYLEMSIAADPENPGVPQIQSTIEQIKKTPLVSSGDTASK